APSHPPFRPRSYSGVLPQSGALCAAAARCGAGGTLLFRACTEHAASGRTTRPGRADPFTGALRSTRTPASIAPGCPATGRAHARRRAAYSDSLAAAAAADHTAGTQTVAGPRRTVRCPGTPSGRRIGADCERAAHHPAPTPATLHSADIAPPHQNAGR